MTTTPPLITALPSAPDPNNRTTFNTLAYPWSAALPAFGTQVSAVGDNVKANADEAVVAAATAVAKELLTNADATSTSADRVQTGFDSAAAAASAATATTQAGIATTKAGEANTCAIAAAASVASIAGGPVASVNGMTGVVTGVQEALVSSINIKTINGQDLPGSGDITIATGLARVLVTTTTQSASSGNDYWATNVAATALTAPTATDSAKFAYTPANGLMANTIDFGAATVRGPFGTVTGILTLDLGLRMEFEYSSTLAKWVSK